MTIVIFKVFAGKMCSAVSPLPQDFYANFGGDPLLMTHRMTASYSQCFSIWNDRTASFVPQWRFVRSVHDRITQQAPVCD